MRSAWLASPWSLPALLLLAGLLRLVALFGIGFPSDVDEIARWAREIAQTRGAIYADGAQGLNYPAVLYLLWPLGALLDDDQLRLAIKALSIPADLLIGILLYAIARRHAASRARCLLAAGLYLLDPAVILAGPYWGQLDAIGTLPYLVALIAAAGGRYPLAGGAAAVAALVKPQFGLVALAIGGVAVVALLRDRRSRPAAGTLAGAAAAAVVVATPLGLSPGVYLELVSTASSPWPYTSLYAFNPWGLVFGFLNSDEPYFAVGAVLLGSGLAAALTPLWRRRDLAALLAVGTFLVFAFYFLPTRVHERYLFPALATLAPLAAVRPRLLGPYLVLCACFSLSLLYALSQSADSTGVVFPESLQDTLFSGPGIIAIGVALMVAVGLTVWRLLSGDLTLYQPDWVPPRPGSGLGSPVVPPPGRGPLR